MTGVLDRERTFAQEDPLKMTSVFFVPLGSDKFEGALESQTIDIELLAHSHNVAVR
jgi:hypothetical protein